MLCFAFFKQDREDALVAGKSHMRHKNIPEVFCQKFTMEKTQNILENEAGMQG